MSLFLLGVQASLLENVIRLFIFFSSKRESILNSLNFYFIILRRNTIGGSSRCVKVLFGIYIYIYINRLVGDSVGDYSVITTKSVRLCEPRPC